MNGSILNCPVTTKDLNNADTIYGKSVSLTKGKTVRTAPERVNVVITPVPNELLRRYMHIHLEIDVMYVN